MYWLGSDMHNLDGSGSTIAIGAAFLLLMLLWLWASVRIIRRTGYSG